MEAKKRVLRPRLKNGQKWYLTIPHVLSWFVSLLKCLFKFLIFKFIFHLNRSISSCITCTRYPLYLILQANWSPGISICLIGDISIKRPFCSLLTVNNIVKCSPICIDSQIPVISVFTVIDISITLSKVSLLKRVISLSCMHKVLIQRLSSHHPVDIWGSSL
jgi:hypothetical protein